MLQGERTRTNELEYLWRLPSFWFLTEELGIPEILFNNKREVKIAYDMNRRSFFGAIVHSQHVQKSLSRELPQLVLT